MPFWRIKRPTQRWPTFRPTSFHPWAAVAAQAETRLLFDVRQSDQIRSLPAAGGAATLIQAASKKWLRLKGRNQLPKLIEGIKFNDGVEVTDANETCFA
jgi:hypothetical protein